MAIVIEHLTEPELIDGELMTKEYNIRITHHRSMESFKLLVRRALNVWPDAPAEIKEFGDILEYGKPLQDYKSQNQPMKKFNEKLPPLLTEAILPTCQLCGGYGYAHHHNCPVMLKDNTIIVPKQEE